MYTLVRSPTHKMPLKPHSVTAVHTTKSIKCDTIEKKNKQCMHSFIPLICAIQLKRHEND